MQKTKIAILSLTAALSALCFTAAYAGDDMCIVDPDDVHCASINGLSAGSNEGRYIKFYDAKLQFSFTACFTSHTSFAMTQDEAQDFPGTNINQYFICADGTGNQCEFVGTDTYTVTQSGDKYISDPQSYSIDLSAVKDKYPACSGWMKKHTLKRPV